MLMHLFYRFAAPSEAEATAHAVPAAHQSSGLTAPLTGTSATSAPANSSNTAHSGAAEEIQEAKASGVNVGAAAAQSGIADAAAETAAAHGLGQSTAPTGAEEILEAKTSGVPVGAELAGAGIAAAAAGSAAAHGLGKSEAEGVTGVEKVAPNVTQATSTSSPSGVGSDKGGPLTEDLPYWWRPVLTAIIYRPSQARPGLVQH